MSDLVKRLCDEADGPNEPKFISGKTLREAAARIESLEAALAGLIAACDAGRPYERGVGGMTIDAQINRTVINGVKARAVEDAREALLTPSEPQTA